MLAYRWEPLLYLVQTGLPELAERSWSESGDFEAGLPFDPDWARYKAMEDSGLLRFMAVRDEAGSLAGYAAVIITGSLHHRGVACAIVQDVYVTPEARKRRGGMGLLWTLQEYLKAMNVGLMSIAERTMVRADKGGTGRVFEYLGFYSNERIWSKTLTWGNA